MRKLPTIHPIPKFEDLVYESETLPNGTKMIWINDATINIGSLSLYFTGGRHIEKKRFVARLYSSMLLESKDQDFLGQTESLGASVKARMDLDGVSISTISLDEHLEKIIDLLSEKLPQLYLDEEIITAKKSKATSAILESLKQKDSLSYRLFTEEVFGKDNAYGYNTTQADISQVVAEDLKSYHDLVWSSSPITAFLIGNLDEKRKNAVRNLLMKFPTRPDLDLTYTPPTNDKTGRLQEKTSLAGSQSAIKIGRRLGQLDEAKFIDTYIANTLLGGYFGSSLSKSIREEKGYTYNIYSHLENYRKDSIFFISSELQAANLDQVISLIDRDLEQKCTGTIPAAEIDDMRQHLMGYFLGMTDGSLNKMRLIQGLVTKEIDTDILSKIYKRLINLKSSDVNSIFSKNFSPDQMLKYVVI